MFSRRENLLLIHIESRLFALRSRIILISQPRFATSHLSWWVIRLRLLSLWFMTWAAVHNQLVTQMINFDRHKVARGSEAVVKWIAVSSSKVLMIDLQIWLARCKNARQTMSSSTKCHKFDFLSTRKCYDSKRLKWSLSRSTNKLDESTNSRSFVIVFPYI